MGYGFVDGGSAWLAVDSRYELQAREQCAGVEIRILASSAAENLGDLLAATGAPEIGIEGDHLTVATFQRYEECLNGRAKLKPTLGIFAELRKIKSEDEITAIREACGIVDEVFEYVCGVLKPGLCERDVMLEIEWRIRKHHGAEMAFPTIVVSGERTALPHGQPSQRVIQSGDLVTLDYGARWEGYCSDLTRTVVVGRATHEQKRVHSIVQAAQQEAIGKMRSGASARDVDGAARGFIAAAGHGEHFGHGLGHSLGLEVHDGPGLSPRSTFELETGMVFTVEPGIYLGGWGGVRIEDDVLVTDQGCEIFTACPRGLLEL